MSMYTKERKSLENKTKYHCSLIYLENSVSKCLHNLLFILYF